MAVEFNYVDVVYEHIQNYRTLMSKKSLRTQFSILYCFLNLNQFDFTNTKFIMKVLNHTSRRNNCL